MAYDTQYTTYDKVALVRNKENKVFVANPNNLDQLNTAVRWAYNALRTFKCVEDILKHDEFDIEIVDNDGFTISIQDAADDSWHGGKLAFWTCLVEKDGIRPFTVGINSILLCELIKYSSMENGKCATPIKFIRKNNQLGAIHDKMPSWAEASVYVKRKADSKVTPKTSKWIPGHVYVTPTLRTYYAGEFFNKLTVNNYGNGMSIIINGNSSKHFCISANYLSQNDGSIIYFDKYDGKLPSRIDGGFVEFDLNAEVRARCKLLKDRLAQFKTNGGHWLWMLALDYVLEVYDINPDIVKSTLTAVRDKYGDIQVRAAFYTKNDDSSLNYKGHDTNLGEAIADIIEILEKDN